MVINNNVDLLYNFSRILWFIIMLLLIHIVTIQQLIDGNIMMTKFGTLCKRLELINLLNWNILEIIMSYFKLIYV